MNSYDEDVRTLSDSLLYELTRALGLSQERIPQTRVLVTIVSGVCYNRTWHGSRAGFQPAEQ